ncbi:amidohydrolase family protein [Clostridium saccharoperbutylacetonicum]|uniref:amidohydrolase family protein n=1 Tax=Clostridium saccharoperbutylacetonicum TaxID=36745 RepID=UPI0039EA978E
MANIIKDMILGYKIDNMMKNYKGNKLQKIDMHVHYIPRAYRRLVEFEVEGEPDGFPTPEWDVESHLKMMEYLGIATTMLSLSSPHLNFGDPEVAKRVARQANEEGAEAVEKYPNKFGLIASLPLPNVKDSIEEINYAFDVLKADGVAFPTNTQGVYLGDPCLDPILEELNNRKAVVILHPNKPSSVPQNVNEELPIPAMEFLFDTTRTVTNMISKGTIRRFNNIKFVIPHAGAFLPILCDRLDAFFKKAYLLEGKEKIDVYGELKKLYYDIAGMCIPRQLETLLEIADHSHLFYGSDYPYTLEVGCIMLAEELDKTYILTDELRQDIYYKNALKLFPRLVENSNINFS